MSAIAELNSPFATFSVTYAKTKNDARYSVMKKNL